MSPDGRPGDTAGMQHEHVSGSSQGSVAGGKVRVAKEAVGTILGTALPTLLIATAAGYHLMIGIESGWNYESTFADWAFIALVPYVVLIENS